VNPRIPGFSLLSDDATCMLPVRDACSANLFSLLTEVNAISNKFGEPTERSWACEGEPIVKGS